MKRMIDPQDLNRLAQNDDFSSFTEVITPENVLSLKPGDKLAVFNYDPTDDNSEYYFCGFVYVLASEAAGEEGVFHILSSTYSGILFTEEGGSPAASFFDNFYLGEEIKNANCYSTIGWYCIPGMGGDSIWTDDYIGAEGEIKAQLRRIPN